MRAWALVAGLFLALSLVRPGASAVLYVNKNASGTIHDGTSWATAFTSLQPAVDAVASGDEVWVATSAPAAPAYEGNVAVYSKSISLYGGFSGTENLRSERRYRAYPTVLMGAGGAHVLQVAAGDSDSVTVDGFTIRDAGYHLQSRPYSAIDISGPGPVTVTHCTLTGSDFGLSAANGAVTVTNCTVTGNITGLQLGSDSATVTGLTVVGNAYAGITLGSSTRAALKNNIIAFNGCYGIEAPSGSLATFTHNDVYGNVVAGSRSFRLPSGQGNLSVDPRISSLFHDIHIQPDSPCRDAGDTAAADGTLDIDGQDRVQGAAVDIGSDESDGTAWPVTTRIRHVSTTGSDPADGLTWETAKRTVGAALAEAQDGDEIWVAEGTYQESLAVSVGARLYGGFAGNEASRSERGASHPTILDGGGVIVPPVILCTGWNVLVDGFAIRNAERSVRIDGGMSALAGNTILGSVVVNNGVAAFVRNAVSGSTTQGIWLKGKGALHGNAIQGNYYEGVDVTSGSSASLSGNTIIRNGGSGVRLDSASGWLANNLIARNGVDGVTVTADARVDLWNNTVYGNLGDGLNERSSYPEFAFVTAANCIFAGNAHYGASAWSTYGTQYPRLWNCDFQGNTLGAVDGFVLPDKAGILTVDPEFANPDADDFHLAAGSPCIDAGDDSAAVTTDVDLDGRPRIHGLHVDIGAYEYGAPAPFTLGDAARALRIAGGLGAGNGAEPGDSAFLDADGEGGLDIRDAVAIARKVAGLAPNP